jgi:hypothetical protein
MISLGSVILFHLNSDFEMKYLGHGRSRYLLWHSTTGCHRKVFSSDLLRYGECYLFDGAAPRRTYILVPDFQIVS